MGAGWRCGWRTVAVMMMMIEGHEGGSVLCWGESGTDGLVINGTISVYHQYLDQYSMWTININTTSTFIKYPTNQPILSVDVVPMVPFLL